MMRWFCIETRPTSRPAVALSPWHPFDVTYKGSWREDPRFARFLELRFSRNSAFIVTQLMQVLSRTSLYIFYLSPVDRDRTQYLFTSLSFLSRSYFVYFNSYLIE